ncbi:hypothetical protein [Crocinitomix catalasitica]|uniref:hypothetical protein n=1 Tax=Crocinitomix catalasitica TaxID=184607 RepID=UPI0004867E26|nr:hypothetical protein [Crocinitomix catalasitica]
MSYLLFFIVLLGAIYTLYRLAEKSILSFKTILLGFGIKLIFATSFILVFTHYYGDNHLNGDAYSFMNDSRVLNEFAQENTWDYLKLMVGVNPSHEEHVNGHLNNTNIWAYGDNGDLMNDNRLLIRINSLVHFYSNNNPYIHAFTMSLLAFIGLLLIHRSFSPFIKNPKLFYWTLLLFPSIAFWSSGITKESLMIFAIGIYCFYLFKIFKTFSWTHLAGLLLGIFLLVLNKPHIGLILISFSFLFILGALSNWSKKWIYITPILAIALITISTYTPNKINLLHKISYKQQDLINFGEGGYFFITDSSFCAFDYKFNQNFKLHEGKKIEVLKPTVGKYKLFGVSKFNLFTMPSGDQLFDLYLVVTPSSSYIKTNPINYQRINLVKSLPDVALNTVFRPFPWDNGSSIKFLALVNNVLFLLIILIAFFYLRPLNNQELYIFTYLIAAALLILLIIGWTTPILGAIVRYKMAAELLIIIAVFIRLKPIKK